VQQLNDLEKQKFGIEKAYLDQRINSILARLTSDDDKAYREDLKEWSKLLNDKQKAEDNYLKNRQKNTDNAATIEEKRWERLQAIQDAYNILLIKEWHRGENGTRSMFCMRTLRLSPLTIILPCRSQDLTPVRIQV
jgi:hypothetical protein